MTNEEKLKTKGPVRKNKKGRVGKPIGNSIQESISHIDWLRNGLTTIQKELLEEWKQLHRNKSLLDDINCKMRISLTEEINYPLDLEEAKKYIKDEKRWREDYKNWLKKAKKELPNWKALKVIEGVDLGSGYKKQSIYELRNKIKEGK